MGRVSSSFSFPRTRAGEMRWDLFSVESIQDRTREIGRMSRYLNLLVFAIALGLGMGGGVLS